MEIKSEQKHLLISPRKVRPVVSAIKKMLPIQAVEKLPFIKKDASELLLKVIKSAIANAVQKGLNPSNLVFKEIQIGEGPRLKRGQPVSRGRWHPIKKRMSHIRVVLKTIEKPKEVVKKEIKKDQVKTTKKGAKNGTKS